MLGAWDNLHRPYPLDVYLHPPHARTIAGSYTQWLKGHSYLYLTSV